MYLAFYNIMTTHFEFNVLYINIEMLLKTLIASVMKFT